MDTLPIELVTIIACDNFKLFTSLLRVNTIGQRLCADYPQLIARNKFISSNINNFGSKATYLNGKLHSFNDQPAVEYTSGDKFWYRYGKIHREYDLPAIVYTSGDKSWYWNGKRHRDDAPALMWDCATQWYEHGKHIRGKQI